MSKGSSAKYYQEYKEKLSTSLQTRKRKKSNFSVDNIKISSKMKSKN